MRPISPQNPSIDRELLRELELAKKMEIESAEFKRKLPIKTKIIFVVKHTIKRRCCCCLFH
jgi:hypothetical protein